MTLIRYKTSFIPFFLPNLIYTYLAVNGFKSEKGKRKLDRRIVYEIEENVRMNKSKRAAYNL